MSFKFLDNYNFIPFAHRGGSYDFCENTLDAFNNSITTINPLKGLIPILLKNIKIF